MFFSPTGRPDIEDPQLVEAMLHKPLKLHLDNLQLVLPTGGTPRPVFPPLRPFFGERWEWRFRRVPDVEPLIVPPPVGVVGGVRRVGDRWLRLLLQGKSPNRRDSGRLPLGQGSPTKDPSEEVHMRLHPEEGLTDGDEANDVQYPSRVEVL